MRVVCLFSVLIAGGVCVRAQHCTGRELDGTYAMQLAGTATISGQRAPVVGLARVVFTSDRTVNGYSSVNFKGLLLGNPVTGTYEVGLDCTLTLNLQDDSGGWQHFRGTVENFGRSVAFRQTDPETGESGVIVRAPDSCSQADLRGRYAFTLSGTKAKGTLVRDLKGQLSVTWSLESGSSLTVPAAANVQGECVVEMEFAPPSGGDPIKLRGMLVNGGAGVLAIETNPNVTVSARFTAQ